MIRAGELYHDLEDEQQRGLKRGPLLPEVTTETARQQAELALGKSRKTISYWGRSWLLSKIPTIELMSTAIAAGGVTPGCEPPISCCFQTL